MPIRPENRGRYPAHWPAIAQAIKYRARWRCECDGRCGWENCPTRTGQSQCEAKHGQLHPTTGSMVALTVAHLDHTPENCTDDNLTAMCQGCHLSYDRDHHAETARQTREAALRAAGQEVLPHGPP